MIDYSIKITYKNGTVIFDLENLKVSEFKSKPYFNNMAQLFYNEVLKDGYSLSNYIDNFKKIFTKFATKAKIFNISSNEILINVTENDKKYVLQLG
jgi:hypothetical protein